ncbi:ABC transporter substrate-binding protein [uncultured Jatrophihabitans sp.]|uniref:ABC transporter substrate-binding protein n=1 Tax=uncultured Jatrophihabitans sp. TaxID=1610747 RepID=UPI0035CC5950
MARLALSLACGDYDRTRALEDGSVRPDGIELTYLRLPVEETFFRMLRHREFDVAEMSMSSYVASLSDEAQGGLVALPVYTSRMFRHSSVYVNTDLVSKPQDLVGAVVGTPEYQLTACVWVRGLLAEDYGVPVDSVRYRTGGQETAGRVEKQQLDLAGRVEVEPIPPDRTLADMLVRGEVAALHTPRVPSPFVANARNVARLWPDTEAEERTWFARTCIFPIMHVVVIRREVYEAHPWVAQSLTKAFTLARDDAYARLYDSSAMRFMDPWLLQHLEGARALLGTDFWSYGVDANRHVLDAFLRHHHTQGLSPRQFTAEEIFAPESLEAFKI